MKRRVPVLPMLVGLAYFVTIAAAVWNAAVAEAAGRPRGADVRWKKLEKKDWSYPNVDRFIDVEMGTVCYVYRDRLGSGSISCLPIPAPAPAESMAQQ